MRFMDNSPMEFGAYGVWLGWLMIRFGLGLDTESVVYMAHLVAITTILQYAHGWHIEVVGLV